MSDQVDIEAVKRHKEIELDMLERSWKERTVTTIPLRRAKEDILQLCRELREAREIINSDSHSVKYLIMKKELQEARARLEKIEEYFKAQMNCQSSLQIMKQIRNTMVAFGFKKQPLPKYKDGKFIGMEDD